MKSCLKSIACFVIVLICVITIGDLVLTIKNNIVKTTLLILIALIYCMSAAGFLHYWEKLFKSKDPYEGL